MSHTLSLKSSLARQENNLMPYPIKASKWLSNFAAFQIGWFASAYWHDSRSLVVVAMMLAWLYHSEPWSKIRIRFTLQVACIGIAMDCLLATFYVLSFETPLLILPSWLFALWFLFASSLSVSLKWMMEKPLVAIAGGAFLGPLAYWAGAQFDALTINPVLGHKFNGYFVMAVCWGAAMGLFSFLFRAQPNNRVVLSSSHQ